jgi:hypothetical protein
MRYKNISITGCQKLFENPIFKNAQVFKTTNICNLFHVKQFLISPEKPAKLKYQKAKFH